MNTWRLLWRGLITALLLGVLAVATVLVLSPELLAPVETALVPVYESIESSETDRLLLVGVGVIGAVTGLVVAIRAESSGGPTPELVGADERPPEATSVDPATVSGYTADRAIEDVASLDGARELRDDLRETAVDALRTAGESNEDARQRVERGEWTDDDLAAGFLGDAAPIPLLARLRGWLDEGAEGRRRLRRSVDAVADLVAAPEEAVRTTTGADDE